ncbi:CsbD-like domain-containing protein [Methylorubrum populi]
MTQSSDHLGRAKNFSVADEVNVTDHAKPASEHTRGSVKEAIGKLTGDARIEAEGKAQKRQARAPKAAPPRD